MATVSQFLSFCVIRKQRWGRKRQWKFIVSPFSDVHLIVRIQNFCWAQMYSNRADRSFGSVSTKVCFQNKIIDNISDLKKRNLNSSRNNKFDSWQFTNGRSKSVLFVKHTYVDFRVIQRFIFERVFQVFQGFFKKK